MKKYLLYLTFAFGLLVFATSVSSCKAGYGCPAEEAYLKNQENPKEVSNKRGSSNLFSKKDRKKVRSEN